MKTWLFLIHLGVTIIFLGLVFGIGFGIINTSILEQNKYQQTICQYLEHTNITYHSCYKSCNTSIPSCNEILSQNITGICYNDTIEEQVKYTQCFIECDTFIILNITFQYNTLNEMTYIQNIQYDCQNNKTCINTIPQSFPCYYNKNFPLNLILVLPPNYRWEYIAVIVILCFLMGFYIVINLTVFKEHNYFCGKKW